MNKAATIEDVKAFAPDYVVYAVGASPIIVRVPGYNKPHITTSIPVFMKERDVGNKVVIVGGGDVGCELAVDLCNQGKDVTIVEMLPDILSAVANFVANHQNIKYLVYNSGAKIVANARLKEILDDAVIVDHNGVDEKIECDDVIFAAGFKASTDLYDEIVKEGYDCVRIGEGIRPPGKFIDAIHQAYHAIRVYE